MPPNVRSSVRSEDRPSILPDLRAGNRTTVDKVRPMAEDGTASKSRKKGQPSLAAWTSQTARQPSKPWKEKETKDIEQCSDVM